MAVVVHSVCESASGCFVRQYVADSMTLSPTIVSRISRVAPRTTCCMIRLSVGRNE